MFENLTVSLHYKTETNLQDRKVLICRVGHLQNLTSIRTDELRIIVDIKQTKHTNIHTKIMKTIINKWSKQLSILIA